MFLFSHHGKQRAGLFLAILLLVAVGATAAHAQDARQDAISQWMQRQLAARQQQYAQFKMSTSDANGLIRQVSPPPAQSASPSTPVDTANTTQDLPSPASYQALQDQISALQRQLARIQAAQQAQAAAGVEAGTGMAPATVAEIPMGTGTTVIEAAPQTRVNNQHPAADRSAALGSSPSSIHDTIKAKTGVDVTLGGWFDGTSVFRSKNESADFISNINTSIPFDNAANAHQTEFRETARATRLRLKVDGAPDGDTKLGAFVESDFAGAASTATSNNTNSYTPRLYQGFFTYDRSDLGMHALAGQAFSLLTMNKSGIDPMMVNTPLTIDTSYVAGFNYTRDPQIRVVEDFDDKQLWVGISAESPQAIVGGLPCTANASSGNCSGFSSTYSVTSSPNSSSFANNVTTDTAPDVVMKAAYDPGWGHYEVFGVTRFFHDNVNSNFHNNIVVGGGGGASMILPVVREYVDFDAQFMVGSGIGRYGPAQMPDFAIMPNGALKPIDEHTGMAGLVGHPDKSWDLYLYGGEEKVFRMNSTNTAYGYGDAGTANSGCYVTGGSCSASTSSILELIPGFWKRVYDGHYGKMQVGAQNSIVRRSAFADSVGSAPHSYEDIAMLSFRYFPF